MMYDTCQFCHGKSYFWDTFLFDDKDCCKECYRKKIREEENKMKALHLKENEFMDMWATKFNIKLVEHVNPLVITIDGENEHYFNKEMAIAMAEHILKVCKGDEK